MSFLQIQVVLTTLLLVITAAKLTEGAGTYQCGHQPTPVHQLKYAAVANTASGPHRGKRQTGSEFRPIRMVPFYDTTVEALPQDQQMLIKNDVIKPVIDFFQGALSVRPLEGKILFQRDCNGNSTPFLNPRGFCPRSEGCANSSKCAGFATFPEDHLAACRVCDDDGTNCETIGQDGAGVENADFILYVGANLSARQCAPGGATLAFAITCQLEKQYDRPIVGFANICVNRAFSDGIMQLRSVLKHEITHALVFSPNVYAFYRDENGNPRTERDPSTGLPFNLNTKLNVFFAGETTIAKKPVKRTTFPNGTFSYEVQMFVTPAILREGRKFFGCDSLPGIPIEDIARAGTGGTHFEQRVFNNEVMTGSVGASNAPFSRFTLALYEDSGWYIPNYDVADPFRWGMNQGCDFVLEGCLRENFSLRPLFCDDFSQLPYVSTARALGIVSLFREIGGNSSCHYDRGSIGVCNKYNKTTPFDPNFQYFLDPELGGTDILADQCPAVEGVISCKRPRDPNLTVNAFAETHGPNSRCVDFRIDGNWIIQNRTVGPLNGGACYEVYCDEVQGPIVSVMGTNHTCTSGKEFYIPQVDLPTLANVITIVCPPCEDLCWDNLDACSAAVTPTTAVPTTTTTGPTPTTAPTAPTIFGASIPSVALFSAALLLLLIAVVVAVVVIAVLCVVRRKQKKARSVQYAKLQGVNDEEEDDDMLRAESED